MPLPKNRLPSMSVMSVSLDQRSSFTQRYSSLPWFVLALLIVNLVFTTFPLLPPPKVNQDWMESSGFHAGFDVQLMLHILVVADGPICLQINYFSSVYLHVWFLIPIFGFLLQFSNPDFTLPISEIVDNVIQNCPIDVRRPLYKVRGWELVLFLWCMVACWWSESPVPETFSIANHIKGRLEIIKATNCGLFFFTTRKEQAWKW